MIKPDQIYFDQIWSDLVWSDLIRFFEICWISGWNFFGHYWSRCFPQFFLEKWNLWSGRLVRSHIFLTCWKFEGRPKKNWQKKPPVNWQRLRFPKLLFFWSGLLNFSFRDLRSSSQSFQLKDFGFSCQIFLLKDSRCSSQIFPLKDLIRSSQISLLKDLVLKSQVFLSKSLRSSPLFPNPRIWDQDRAFYHWRSLKIFNSRI